MAGVFGSLLRFLGSIPMYWCLIRYSYYKKLIVGSNSDNMALEMDGWVAG